VADKTAKIAATKERQLQLQARKVTTARQKLLREESRQNRQLKAAVKTQAKQHQKDTSRASRQLAINLQESAKKLRKARTNIIHLPVPSFTRPTPKLAKEPVKVATTRSRTIRPPRRYQD
jgi:hypothetical protein